MPAAWTLALGGARRLRLVDPDVVDLSNLHRQVLYTEADVGRRKADVLAERLVARHPDLSVEIVYTRVEKSSTAAILDTCDAAMEGTDDAESKFLVSDHVASHGKYATIAAAIGRRGQWLTMQPGGPCYRCLFEAPPPADLLSTCSVAGVMGSLTGQVGSLAALSLLRALRGEADAAIGALVRLSPRGLQRTAVEKAGDCAHHPESVMMQPAPARPARARA